MAYNYRLGPGLTHKVTTNKMTNISSQPGVRGRQLDNNCRERTRGYVGDVYNPTCRERTSCFVGDVHNPTIVAT